MYQRIMYLFGKKKIPISGAVLGAVAGYLYYYFVGCSTGTCAITSRPFSSSIHGAVMGYLLLSVFEKNK